MLTINRIFFGLVILVYLFFAASCGKEKEEAKPPVQSIKQYTLEYLAGESGSIKGISLQKVDQGDSGSEVIAVPAEHYHFTGWSDGVATASRTDADVMSDLTVTANFAIDQYTLTYSAGEKGSISGTSPQKVDHGGSGSEVVAVPAGGYHFTGWSDGAEAAGRIDENVTADLEVTAVFAINQYTLTYAAGANGSIEGTTSQTVNHGDKGTRITAKAAENYHFTTWSDGVTTADRTDTDVSSDVKVTANFAIDQYTLTYSAGEKGSIKGTSPQKVDHGGSGSEVMAVPADGFHFTGWSDGATTAKRLDKNVTADLKATAGFAINQYTLTYTAGENGSIEGVTPQKINHGGTGTGVTAVPAEGYRFVTWDDGVATDTRIDSKITANLTVSAVFEIKTYTVGGTVSGLIEGTSLLLRNNDGDDLTITNNGFFNFTDELLNGETYTISVLVQPTTPNQHCTVSNGTGKIPAANVTNIEVICVPLTYTIGGTVSGLPKGDRIVLRNNNGNDLAIDKNGSFVFTEPLDDGSAYKVNIHTPPKRQNWNCELANGAGTLSGRDVTDIVVDCYPLAVLKSKAGFRKITLTWNIEDFNEIHDNIVVFNFCRTEEEIPPDNFRHCRDFEGGVIERKVTSSPFIVQDLPSNTPYWFQLQVLADSGNRRTYSEVVKAIPFGGLNDTGIDWCADDNNNYDMDGTLMEKTRSCDALAQTFPDQDAVHGWDALARTRELVKKGRGAAGFDFTKICNSGDAAGEEECPPNPFPGSEKNNWGCTRDNVTGLTWEIKVDDGLRNKNNTYSWYNPDNTSNGGDPGLQNGGDCSGSDCDTLSYVQTANDLNLCGVDDWRLPTRQELLSIIDNSRFKPAVDPRYFPNTLPAHYWSSSPYPEQENSAWQVYFLYGESFPDNTDEKNHIRLVRGRTVTFGLENP